jgi:phosphoinositide-3-kinase, regulatory subunit 4
MPQTVFLKPRTEAARSPRAPMAHRRISDITRGSLPTSPRLGSRRNSVDQGASAPGAPFEDLRRRLATINGSVTSLNAPPRSPLPRPASLVSTALIPTTPDVPDFTPPIERPGSPTESVVSTANSSAFRAMHRLQAGAGEVSKAAPAVGSSKTNATGLFEQATTIRSEASPERVSGLVSPHFSRPRDLTIMPVSTYGKHATLPSGPSH